MVMDDKPLTDDGPAVAPLVPSAAEAAKALGLSRSGFLALVRRGKAPAPLRLGRRTVWPREVLERFIREAYRLGVVGQDAKEKG